MEGPLSLSVRGSSEKFLSAFDHMATRRYITQTVRSSDCDILTDLGDWKNSRIRFDSGTWNISEKWECGAINDLNGEYKCKMPMLDLF